jgi:predicted permease
VKWTNIPDIIWQDTFFALRTLRKNLLFAAVAVLTSAIGIGGSTAIFTVIRSVLLKPLQYRDPARLIRVTLNNAGQTEDPGNFSEERYREIRSSRSLSSLAVHLTSIENVTLAGGGFEPELLREARVSANFLETLGVRPALGRAFLHDEDTHGGPVVAMISASLWKRRFGANPRIAGLSAIIDSTPHTIIGVLPEGFAFPFAGLDVWVTRPSEFSGLQQPSAWLNTPLLIGFGRLASGVSVEQARAELNLLNRSYDAAHPGLSRTDPNATIRVALLSDYLVANVRPMLWLLFGAVGLTLLIACANVASLLLARAASRSGEFALRVALGAPRSRLVMQLLAESLVLAVVGGVLGLLTGQWSLSTLVHWNGFDLPRAAEIGLDGLVLAFNAALSILAGLLFGLMPALQATRPDLAYALRDQGKGSASWGARRNVLGISARELLVMGQMALTIVLLIAGALLLRSIVRLRSVDPGFQPANLLTMQVPLPAATYNTPSKRLAFYDELFRRLKGMPGVRGASVSLTLPTVPTWQTPMAVAEQPPVAPQNRPFAQFQSVTPGYFGTLGIRLRRGRDLSARDEAEGAQRVTVINESLARRFWPAYPAGQDPVGQHLLMGSSPVEIVGIVADTHEAGPAADTAPEWYLPLRLRPPQSGYVAVRTQGDPKRLVDAIRKQVLAIDKSQAISEVKTMDEVLDASEGRRHMAFLLLGSFAGAALLLAMVGIYGVVAYSVAQRTKELGIRRALGAREADVLRLVLRQALTMALVGVAVGLGCAYSLTWTMEKFLFRISPVDPVTFAGVALVFVMVSLAASFVPAWRATMVDPMTSLRT